MGAAAMSLAVSCMDENALTEKPAAAPATSDYEYVEGDVIVKFRAGASSSIGRQSSLLSTAQAEFVETIRASDEWRSAPRHWLDGASLILWPLAFSVASSWILLAEILWPSLRGRFTR